MSNKQGKAKRIHPKVLRLLGNKVCFEMLAVARDLRSGVIPKKMYNQSLLPLLSTDCETACCILGWLRRRLPKEEASKLTEAWLRQDCGLMNLFGADHPSDPYLAADAIEHFVFENLYKPWSKGNTQKGKAANHPFLEPAL